MLMRHNILINVRACSSLLSTLYHHIDRLQDEGYGDDAGERAQERKYAQ